MRQRAKESDGAASSDGQVMMTKTVILRHGDSSRAEEPWLLLVWRCAPQRGVGGPGGGALTKHNCDSHATDALGEFGPQHMTKGSPKRA